MSPTGPSSGAPPLSMSPPDESPSSPGMHEASRREKLRKIQELGLDPWGSRLDGQMPIAEIRAREAEIVVEPIPAGSQQREPTQHGPQVRAAGRIVLQREKGKLIFVDIRDWTGQIQLFIGQKPGRRRELGPGRMLRPGRPRRRRRRAQAHQDRRADDLRREAALSHQVARAAARKAPRPDRSGTAAADALSRPDPTAKACCRGF